jgi:DegV family protein with EDD domain
MFPKDLNSDKIDFHVVPLTMILGEEEFVDTEDLDTADFVARMKVFKGCPKSACPTPEAYYDIMAKSDNIIVVALSSGLSGTHASAVTASERIKTDFPNKKLFVFDTLNACTGLDFVCQRLAEVIEKGDKNFDEVTAELVEIGKRAHTRFLLQDLSNLIKNGRMPKMLGKVLTTANIKFICGNDGEGGIKKFGMGLGTRRGLNALAEMPKDEITPDMPIIINHVLNEEDALYVKELLVGHGFTNIKLYGMRGLSSLYAADKGIVIAY